MTGLRIFINGNLSNAHGSIAIDKHTISLDDHIVRIEITCQIPRKLFTELLMVNYCNASVLEIYCHSLQSYTLVGSFDVISALRDSLCITHTSLEGRLVGCEPVPHHQVDSTSDDLLLADLHRLGVTETNSVEGGSWRICRANASFIVIHSSPFIPRSAPLIPESLPHPQVSVTRLCCMLPASGPRDACPSSPTSMPRMGPPSHAAPSR